MSRVVIAHDICAGPHHASHSYRATPSITFIPGHTTHHIHTGPHHASHSYQATPRITFIPCLACQTGEPGDHFIVRAWRSDGRVRVGGRAALTSSSMGPCSLTPNPNRRSHLPAWARVGYPRLGSLQNHSPASQQGGIRGVTHFIDALVGLSPYPLIPLSQEVLEVSRTSSIDHSIAGQRWRESYESIFGCHILMHIYIY